MWYRLMPPLRLTNPTSPPNPLLLNGYNALADGAYKCTPYTDTLVDGSVEQE